MSIEQNAMKFENIPADFKLTAFNLLLVLGVLLVPESDPLRRHVEQTYGAHYPSLALIVGAVLGVASYAALYFKPRGDYYRLAAAPTTAVMGLIIMLEIQSGASPLTVGILFATLIGLFENFAVQRALLSHKQALKEALAREDAA